MRTEKAPKSRDILLALSGVWTVAVAKPVLDVVGNAPAYWSANRIDAVTLCILVFVLTLLPPVLLAGVFVALKGGRRVFAASVLYFSTVFTILLTLAIYHNLSLVWGKPVLLVPASFVVASLVVVLYWRSTIARLFFSAS